MKVHSVQYSRSAASIVEILGIVVKLAVELVEVVKLVGYLVIVAPNAMQTTLAAKLTNKN